MHSLVGVLLLSAAAFKVWEVVLEPAMAVQGPLGATTLPLQITGEFALGILAGTGLYWRQSRVLAIAVFAAFAGYSLTLALQGAASCGCFGPVKVSPWWTFLLDVSVLGALIADWWLGRNGASLAQAPSPNFSPEYRGKGLMLLFAIGGVSCALFLALVWQTSPTPDSANYLLQTVGDLTILEPESWTGKSFPIHNEIDLDVSRGDWVLLFHRHDCTECQAAVPQYEQLATEQPDLHVALIEVPPYFSEQHRISSTCVVGRLTADREWFVQTPVEIRLQDGVVVAASTELPAIREELAGSRVIEDENVQLTGFPAVDSVPLLGKQL